MKKAASEIPAPAQQEERRILLVEDDVGLQKQMRWALSPHAVDVAGSRAEAIAQINASKPYQVVILDLGLPPDENSASEGLKALDEILKQTPLGRLGQPADIADVVAFLCSDDASFMTGGYHTVDGGWMAGK